MDTFIFIFVLSWTVFLFLLMKAVYRSYFLKEEHIENISTQAVIIESIKKFKYASIVGFSFVLLFLTIVICHKLFAIEFPGYETYTLYKNSFIMYISLTVLELCIISEMILRFKTVMLNKLIDFSSLNLRKYINRIIDFHCLLTTLYIGYSIVNISVLLN